MKSPTSELLGRQLPSVELLPSDSVGSAGPEAVELAAAAGLELDPWQAYVLEHSLSEQADGLWSAFLCAVVVSRQNGKGSILEAREIAGLFLLGEHLILHSAHEFKTCYEHFLRVVSLIENTPDLDRRVQKIRRGVGEQAIELRNGNRLRFIARSSGSGRGMSAPCVVLDEAMYLTEAQVGAIMPTLSAQANPQLWFTSSAPLATSFPLHRLRQQAIEKTATRLFYAEWGNELDVDPTDDEAVARANPALGRRIFFDFVDAEREAMSREEFARERLGVPEMPIDESLEQAIPMVLWSGLFRDGATPTSDIRLALDVPPEQTSAAFAIAGRRGDDVTVDVCEDVKPAAMGQLVARAKALTDKYETSLILPPNSQARGWRTELEAAGVPLDLLAPAEYAEACAAMKAAVMNGSVKHTGHIGLMAAVSGLGVKTAGDVDVWSRRNSSVNIAPFVAATCALVRVPEASCDFFAY